ncbi:flagellin N-terminal helical domain-containing protein [Modestobacter altitudinis]|uniref:flagellin N-terminal helical domain-containing protein n=1 Tax=Modestobacter altitudinis TaxID=2213158 RepID=UPI001FE70689|nr:flagellin [Modestobacter altitudinis]
MSVNTNIASMNAYRNLSSTQDSMSKSLERLSSGFRINRAADDAAGLAISEGLKSQIGGLTQAVRNTQDGTSVTQTAEGALNETTSILQRMRDLSVQASNDGGLNTDAKTSIQKEMTQLKEELTRISDTTTFNGTKLLDGSYNKTFQVGANAGETIGVSIKTASNTGLDAVGLGVGNINVTAAGGTYAAATSGTAAGTVTSSAANATTAGSLVFHSAGSAGVDDFTADKTAFTGLTGSVAFGGKTFDLSTVDYSGATDGATALAALNLAARKTLGVSVSPFAATSATALTFSLASTEPAISGITASGGKALGTATDQVAIASPKFSAQSGASAAINAIDAAIKTVSGVRADLGAIQNRFEHTINNLNVAIENTTASNSRIRDTDMAAEMSKFTRSQVLTQAGTSMLAQANQSTQSILKLLG